MSPLAGLFIVLLLIAANGFFVATEFSLVSSRTTRINQVAAQGSRAARLVQSAKANPTRFISGTQLGVTVASLMLGWLGEQTFAQLIQPVLDTLWRILGQATDPSGEPSTTANAIASVLAIALMTVLTKLSLVPPLWGAIGIVLGCAAALATSLLRARRIGPR